MSGSSRSLAIILNPVAGNRRAGKAHAKLLEALAENEAQFELVPTTKPCEATDIAAEAAKDFDVVVAAGGDGTIQEVASGLVRNGARAPLGLIPLGTGNDLAKLIGMSFKPEKAIRQLLESDIVPLDTGHVRWRNHGSDEWEHGIFMNAVGIGFDAVVATEAVRFKKFGGMIGYFMGIFSALSKWPRPDVRVERLGESVPIFHGGTTGSVQSDVLLHKGRLFMAAVGNGRTIGGGFNINPYADPLDGSLDLCFVENVTNLRLPIIIPMVIKGTHLKAREVLSERLGGIRILSENHGLPLHFDGEVLTTSAEEVEVTIRKASINVVCPRHSFASGAY